ncbi:MAG: hypothetical protein C0594_10205 [Marinilabiliales bacterium]|nr:MAG: hypothetical protein C0594_10205 [Marinilabiliales bacterium]
MDTIYIFESIKINKRFFRMKINCKDYDSIISNITAAFYGVNVKINDLLLFMESDFVKLSKDIRNYYEQVKIVSDGSRQVSDKILDGGGVEFFKILKQSNDRVSEIKTFCNELYSFLHQGLDDIQHNTKNLHTKFNKLAIFTEESGNTEFANAYRDLSEKLNNVQSEITEITDHIEKVKTMVIDELIQKIDALNGQIQLQEFEHERALDNAKYLDEKVINCIDNIEKLIINIQYHDIIRQKMEHIAAANEDTVDNLQRFSSTLEHSDELECKKYMAILPMVAKIHRNKIEYSKDECEQALNSIMSELKQILEDTTYLSVFRIDFYNYLFY